MNNYHLSFKANAHSTIDEILKKKVKKEIGKIP